MNIKTVTVIGANGTMGCNVSAIFASFGNAKVYMVSRDMEKSKKAAIKAGNSVKASSIMNNLIPADYSMLDQCVSQSDLVFESVAENLEAHAHATDVPDEQLYYGCRRGKSQDQCLYCRRCGGCGGGYFRQRAVSAQ